MVAKGFPSYGVSIVRIELSRIHDWHSDQNAGSLSRSNYVQKERDIAATTAPMTIPASTSLR
jgi:hypothetical protein